MKRTKATIDAAIGAAYKRHCAGTMIAMLDIGKVFAAGREALASGTDLDVAIKTAIVKYDATPKQVCCPKCYQYVSVVSGKLVKHGYELGGMVEACSQEREPV